VSGILSGAFLNDCFFTLQTCIWGVKMPPVGFILNEEDENLTSHSDLALIGALFESSFERGVTISGRAPRLL
jgi:hypothetical protein